MATRGNLKDEARELIVNNQIDKAFKLLNNVAIEGQIDDLQNNLILLQSRYSGLKREVLMGVISTDQEALQHNRIVHSLLGIISDLPDGLELEELQAPDIKSRPQEEINKETIRKKEDRPSPPQVEQSPKSVRDSDRLRKGNYYLYLPSKMLLNQAATCLVRVIPEGSEFEEGMVRNMTSQPGLISEEMTISMLSPSEEEAFHIQPLSANQKLS